MVDPVTLPPNSDSLDRPPYDAPRVERAVREILVAIGEDPDRDGLRDTPPRVARAYEEMFLGLRTWAEDVDRHLRRPRSCAARPRGRKR